MNAASLGPALPYGHAPAAIRKAASLEGADMAFLVIVILFASDAFAFLGLNSIIWLSCYGYFMLRLCLSLSQITDALRRNLVFLAYPALAMVSVLWSDIPDETLRFSLQLMFTVLIAVFLGSRFGAQRIFQAFFAVMLVALIVSVMNITSAITPAYDARDLFQGIFLSKNALGHRTALFAATCAFGLLLSQGRPLLRLGCLLGLGVVATVLAVAGSATGIVFAVAASGGGMLLWLILRWRGAWAFLGGLILSGLGLFVIASLFTRLDPLSFLLQLVGRDATLTGRTILWDFGWEHYLMRPWLGFGASGFWDNPLFAADIIALRQRYGEGVSGFHNLILELLVMLGPLGVLAHAAVTMAALGRSLWHARRRCDPLAAWAFVSILAILGMSMLGAQFYQGHSIVIMLVVMLGSAFSLPDRAPQAGYCRNPHLSPQPEMICHD